MLDQVRQKANLNKKNIQSNGNGESTFKIANGEIKEILKRDGRKVPFDITKVANAAYSAMQAVGEGNEEEAVKIARKVYLELLKLYYKNDGFTPTVESVQDLVEKHLILSDLVQTAKAFILYRKEHEELRVQTSEVSEEIKNVIKEGGKHFRNKLAEFVYYVSYARWRDDLGRRETWTETVERFMVFMKEKLGKKLTTKEYEEVKSAILNQEVIPSMRLLWSSGDAARASNVTAYNCSFVSISELRDFAEIMYISMCGCGVGFSVEEKAVERLPIIKPQRGTHPKKHTIKDSKEGWSDAFLLALETWYEGKDIEFDFSKIRPKGARLVTMGGRASGPEPLMELMAFTKDKILTRQGKRLRTIDVHDIACKVGEVVVAGGVRRSAMISLSDVDDMEMRDAKQGQFWLTEPQRSMANNSAVYEERPSNKEFLKEWLSLASSGTGERGIFNRGNLLEQLPARRRKHTEKYIDYVGTNPCGEIILRSRQFCNLTAIVARPQDNLKTLSEKIRLATILGTYQATLTDFAYLSSDWKKNCREEALLGVSFTGYYDNDIIRNPKVLSKLKKESVKTNEVYAKRFGINRSTCVTCVKPSGNSSQLLDTASGMHPRYAKYYVRRVRIASTDPLMRMLKDQGVPCYPEVGQDPQSASTFVLEFPVASPLEAVVKDDVGAIELLEEWKKIKTNFTEHNPSATIYVGENEWIEVANWVYKNWQLVGGLTFLPRTDHVYQLAPYEEIDEATYTKLSKNLKGLDFSKMVLYEKGDNTTGAKEYACIGGACEI